MVACAHLGRMEEARNWLRRSLELDPGLTITAYKKYVAVFLPAEILAVYIEGFRKAGMPEE